MSISELPAEPQVCVAFGVEFADIAREDGTVFDVDSKLLKQSLMHGGMTEDDIVNIPTVIYATHKYGEKGWAIWEDPDMPDEEKDAQDIGTHVELLSYYGTGDIMTSDAAHEGKHMADRLHIGDRAFVSYQAKIGRKIAAVAGSIMVGALSYLDLKAGFVSTASTLELGASSIVISDLLLTVALEGEYLIRKEERKARRVQRQIDEQNILILTDVVEFEPGAPISKYREVFEFIKGMFIPDFGH